MTEMRHKNLLFWTLELLAAAALIWVLSQMSFILEPMGKFVKAVFVPLLISGFLYYLLNPIVGLVQKISIGKFRMPRGLSIAIVMIGFLVILIWGVGAILPTLGDQLTKVVSNMPQYIRDVQSWLNHLSDSTWMKHLESQIDWRKLQKQVEAYGSSMVVDTASGLSSVLGTVTSFTINAITIPVMTIYILADGHRFSPFITKVFSKKTAPKVAEVLGRLNDTLSKYISGQAIEMIFVGVATTIGYFLIGQNYALLLGVIAGLTNLIPYVGPYIGYIPAVMVGFMQSPTQAFWTTVVVLVVQQIDSNILYPRIIGSTLNIHPLTILVLLLAAGNIAGIPGMIVAVPFYAIIRTVVIYLWQLWQLRRQSQAEEFADDAKDVTNTGTTGLKNN